MKKYQIGGSMQSRTSDELNPNKIKKPIAPNPSFISSSKTDKMKKGGQIKKCKKCPS